MKCKVDGCDRDAHYKAVQLCQKHYFRHWRYGTTDTIRRGKAKPRHENPAGYQLVLKPAHPLAQPNGYVYEHRAVLYDAIGPGPMCCDLCGVGLTWASVRVDHIDNNPRNNDRANLRPTCNTCNSHRGIGPAVTWTRSHKIEYQGELKTASEWARDPRVKICGRQIVLRLREGMTVEEALFSPKRTHNGGLPKPTPRKTQFKHQRKNAIRIEIDGVVMTAAEWSRHPDCKVSEAGLTWRIKNGWSPKEAVFKPGRFA